MTEPDESLTESGDISAALGLLSRLPMSVDTDRAQARGAAAAWAWPLAGAVLGGLAGLVGWVALVLGFTPGVSAAIVLAALILMTGAMHEDGLADTADGLWGGWEPARRLEIMKDSRIGTYGVLALGLSLLARWSALTSLIAAGSLFAPLIAAGMLSRAPMVAVMAALPNARGDGLSQSVGRPGQRTVTLAILLAFGGGLAVTGWAALPAALMVAIVVWALSGIAMAKIGGQTGDILGASQQLAEIAVLAVLAARLA
ncbi:MAG: adenosylcobinamide-GDP ribazoletransferase [Rhodobacteraceae bacterium]|nr:adenosylcobinamide-GDP ribazoletransferase [Paracoccaceae bacterium]